MASVHQTAPQSNLVQINCDFGEVRRFDCAMSYSGSPAHTATALKRIGGHPILQNAVAALIPSLNLNGSRRLSRLTSHSGPLRYAGAALLWNGPQGPAALGLTAGQCPRTQTPVLATVVAGSIVLAAALLVPFEGLLVTTNALTLGVFVLVDRRCGAFSARPRGRGHLRSPRWVPPLGAFVALTLMLGEFLL